MAAVGSGSGTDEWGPHAMPSREELSTLLDTLNQQTNSTSSNTNSTDEVRVDMGAVDAATLREGLTVQASAAERETEIRPLAILMPYLAEFGIFILILLLKVLYSHRYGLLIIIATSVTWYHADSMLTTQITLRGHVRYKEFTAKLTWVIVFLSLNLFGIYYFLDESHFLIHRLAFLVEGLDDGKPMEIWTLLWMLLINDFAIKYCTIISKSFITLIPKSVISHQQKGSLYCALERVTELYRSLVPIVPWYFFLLGTRDGPWFSAVLFIIYVVFKFLSLYKLWTPLKTALMRVFSSNVSYGSKPSSHEIEEAEGTCPVCHEEYTDPIVLQCKHIFCEDCVLVWFDREKSCPMCRAQIITGDNCYRDGSSSRTVQFF